MPYIKHADYVRAARLPLTPGELNYAITLKAIFWLEGFPNTSLAEFYEQVLTLCKAYITRRGLNYTVGNEVLGVVACSGLEMMRRCGDLDEVSHLTDMLADVGNRIYVDLLAPYEDDKIVENGDVYPIALVN